MASMTCQFGDGAGDVATVPGHRTEPDEPLHEPAGAGRSGGGGVSDPRALGCGNACAMAAFVGVRRQ